MRRVLVFTLFLGVVLASHGDESFEIEESERSVLSEQGQRNCVEEASESAASNLCPRVETGRPYPPSGIRILGALFLVPGILDVTTLDRPYPDSGFSYERSARLGPILPPGEYSLEAWFGVWNDTDGDRVIDSVRIHPQFCDWGASVNEWIPERSTSPPLVAFVEPGPRPGLYDNRRPSPPTPDLILASSSGCRWSSSAMGPVVFLDGSLGEGVTTTVVSDSYPYPSAGTLYSPTPRSLVDIDRYFAFLPDPLSRIWEGVVGPILDEYSTPSYGLCPNSCSGGPIPSRGLPDPLAHVLSLQGALFPPYPPEWEEGSRSSAEGRREEYGTSPHAWIDLLVGRAEVAPPTPGSIPSYGWGPLVGRRVQNSTSIAPGYVTFVVWEGIFRDLDGNGRIGCGDPTDPYEGGSKPLPDDYLNPCGEFEGSRVFTITGVPSSVRIVVRPKGAWGGEVVAVHEEGGAPRSLFFTPVHSGERTHLIFYLYPSSTTQGVYVPWVYGVPAGLLLPQGSPPGGFEICTDTLAIPIGGTTFEPVWDCDEFVGWM